MKRLIRPLAIHIIRGYFSLRFFWPIWYYVLNRVSRRFFLRHIPVLDSVGQRIARDLADTGIAITHIDELFPSQNLLPALQDYTQKRITAEAKKIKKSKPFLEYMWDEIPTLDPYNPFIPFALNSRVLDIVNTYLSLWSRFYYLTLNVTHPVSEGAGARTSQRWHRDPEDKRQCKMFLYLSDVDEHAGPFTYMRRSTWGKTWGNHFCQKPPKGCYPEDGAVEKIIPEKEKIICTGKAGTIIFCDTTGIHRGGYATRNRRIMFTAGYMTNASASPSLFNCSETFRQHAMFSKPAQYALQKHRTPVATYLYYRYKRMFRKKNSSTGTVMGEDIMGG